MNLASGLGLKPDNTHHKERSSCLELKNKHLFSKLNRCLFLTQ